MNQKSCKRLLLAAPRSGSGKTTITCALLQALLDRGLDPAGFKCGPDYIDPMFHKQVLGIESRNLDSFFAGAEGIRETLSGCPKEYAVIEGVMGLYDGTDVKSTAGSAYEIAALTQTPIILIMDASGIGRSVISLIKGVLADDDKGLIRGLILNRISKGFYEKLRPVLEEEIGVLRADVTLLGYMPKQADIALPARHLGLLLPTEIADIRERIRSAAACLKEGADLDALLRIMEEAPLLGRDQKTEDRSREGKDRAGVGAGTGEGIGEDVGEDTGEGSGKTLTLAVARDEAFCFYYPENLELFAKKGVRIRCFSPLRDEALPKEADGILLGGGYPELYLKELCQNKSMRRSIREAIEQGIPSLAECGGFMYLHSTITDKEGKAYEMVGAVDGDCSFAGHLVRFGYLQIESVGSGQEKNPLLESMIGMRGHEFHYYESTDSGNALVAAKPDHSGQRPCIIAAKNGVWGYPHFYYPSDPAFAACFIKRMKEVFDGKQQ
ncbi:MAG: cobyrinate a,c-diamide synthase [Lachnospiraceae bacterium]|nr:cobyrinate a,c-diamide synthase [Lachnospiraceae bacterium]